MVGSCLVGGTYCEGRGQGWGDILGEVMHVEIGFELHVMVEEEAVGSSVQGYGFSSGAVCLGSV